MTDTNADTTRKLVVLEGSQARKVTYAVCDVSGGFIREIAVFRTHWGASTYLAQLLQAGA